MSTMFPSARQGTKFCYIRQMTRMRDRAGIKYGRLTAVKRVENGKSGVHWLCQCECGNQIQALGINLGSGNTTSCGCLSKEFRLKSGEKKTPGGQTHGLTYHPLFMMWGSMRARCDRPSHQAYPRYGGRGISYDPRWKDFPTFLADVGERPDNPDHWVSKRPYWTLDRIDPDGDYRPGNVRWATPEQQRENRTENITWRL